MLHFQPKLHQNTFGGRAPPGPARGAQALPSPPSRSRGGEEGRGGGRGKGRGNGAGGRGMGGRMVCSKLNHPTVKSAPLNRKGYDITLLLNFHGATAN
jgi:hypothetical protein